MIDSSNTNRHSPVLKQTSDEEESDMRNFRMWGLTAEQLHDAYWRSRGIQCVRRSLPFMKQSGADMFMLMDMDQFVSFDLNSIAESIVWNRAPVSRVRVKTPLDDYVEKVISRDGQLIRITRDYTSRYMGSHSVKLTRRPSIAEAWSRNESRYRALRELRRYVDWSKTDSYEVEGEVDFTGRNPERDEVLVNRLVSVWKKPGESINGIKELRPGIWGVNELQLGADEIAVVPPIWIGGSKSMGGGELKIGPMAIPDDLKALLESR